jgi:hypothetical protein
MHYFWNKNKTAEVWFRNKRKPPEHNHKLINDIHTPYSFIFGSLECREFFNADAPTVDKFSILRLTSQIGGYKASGTVFVNDSSFVTNIKKYCFETRDYVTGPGLCRIMDVDFFTYSRSYNAKVYGSDEVPEEVKQYNEKYNITYNHQLSADNKHIYADLFLELPNIAKELFSVIPEVKRKQ